MRRTRTMFVVVVILLVLNVSGLAQTLKPENDSLSVSPIVASLSASVTTIVLPCNSDMVSQAGNCPRNTSTQIQLSTTTSDPKHDGLGFTYKVTAGRINGEGAHVIWDLEGVAPGTYTAAVERFDGFGGIVSANTMVTIANCPDCVPGCALCPMIVSSCPDDVDPGQPLTFVANVGVGSSKPSYHWTVSAGTITSGQGTTAITVSTEGLGGQSVTATLEVEGMDPACGKTTSCTTRVRPQIVDIFRFDEYGNIRFSDEKARLDNFGIQLQQNEAAAVGYLIGYGSCKGEGVTRANRARKYLVNSRRLDPNRLVVVDGGCRAELVVTLWILPREFSPPGPDTTGAVAPCPACKQKPSRQKGRSGRNWAHACPR